MRYLLVALILGGVGARWGMVTMDDATLRDDVLFSDLLTSNRPRVDAAVLAPFIERAIQQRHCELVPDTLKIAVHDAREGTLKVAGAGFQIQGTRPTKIQDIDIRFDCMRPGTFFAKSKAEFRLRTQAMGEGRANHWPRVEGDADGSGEPDPSAR